jgi:hypothetical protein
MTTIACRHAAARTAELEEIGSLIVVPRAQYEALLAFYGAWGEYEVAVLTGDRNLLAERSKELIEKRRLLHAELRVAALRAAGLNIKEENP